MLFAVAMAIKVKKFRYGQHYHNRLFACHSYFPVWCTMETLAIVFIGIQINLEKVLASLSAHCFPSLRRKLWKHFNFNDGMNPAWFNFSLYKFSSWPLFPSSFYYSLALFIMEYWNDDSETLYIRIIIIIDGSWELDEIYGNGTRMNHWTLVGRSAALFESYKYAIKTR